MSHVHEDGGWRSPDELLCVEIDPEVCLRPQVRDGKLTAFILGHVLEGREFRHEGLVRVDPSGPGPVWRMEGKLSQEDLTLHPSLMCSCGFHGWVREGHWEWA